MKLKSTSIKGIKKLYQISIFSILLIFVIQLLDLENWSENTFSMHNFILLGVEIFFLGVSILFLGHWAGKKISTNKKQIIQTGFITFSILAFVYIIAQLGFKIFIYSHKFDTVIFDVFKDGMLTNIIINSTPQLLIIFLPFLFMFKQSFQKLQQ